MSSSPGKWFPLESNPTLINQYIEKLGFDTSLYCFCDVFSTEDWAMDMIPQPVAAVIMLYPLSEKQESFRGQDTIAPVEDLRDVWFTKQRIGNACGTIGLLHSLLNAPEPLRACVRDDSWLQSFQQECHVSLSPAEKADKLETNTQISKLHDQATSSQENQTSRGNIDDKVDTHFIALVCVKDQLYELDGRKDGPVVHGPTTQNTLLRDACQVIKNFMKRDPDEVRFTILALAPKQDM